MNKTELRGHLTKAVNGARALKNTGLSPTYYWAPVHGLKVAADLHKAANAIEEFYGRV